MFAVLLNIITMAHELPFNLYPRRLVLGSPLSTQFFLVCSPVQDGSGQLELNEILVMMGDDEHGRDFLQYADTNGSSSLTLDEWQSFFLGFWRYHPQMARHNVGFLMGRAAELRSMPSLPPAATAA